MKVLYTLDSLNRGGSEMLTLDVCRNARGNGLEAGVAAFKGGRLRTDFLESGAEFFDVGRMLPFDPGAVRRLRTIINSGGFEIVHSEQPVTALHAFFATRGTRVRNVLSFPGFYSGLKNSIAARFLVPRMAANIACSKGLLEWLAGEASVDTSERFRVIYNGVDRSRIIGYPSKVRTELRLSEEALLVGMAAHFYAAERKDHLTLCKAFASIANDLPNAQLIVTGGVEAGAEAKLNECVQILASAGLSKRAHFLGTRDDLADVTSALDICVMSSFHEGLPIALMEALLIGKPCVISDIPPHREVAEDGKTAELFRVGDASDLAEKLRSLGGDENERVELGIRGKQFAERTFTIERHIESLRFLYREIL